MHVIWFLFTLLCKSFCICFDRRYQNFNYKETETPDTVPRDNTLILVICNSTPPLQANFSPSRKPVAKCRADNRPQSTHLFLDNKVDRHRSFFIDSGKQGSFLLLFSIYSSLDIIMTATGRRRAPEPIPRKSPLPPPPSRKLHSLLSRNG